MAWSIVDNRPCHNAPAIYLVNRVCDPRQVTRLEDAGVTAFDYDPAWSTRGHHTPAERVAFEAETVEAGVRENTPRMGTFTFECAGKSYTVVLIGKDMPKGVQPVAHVGDLTSGHLRRRPRHRIAVRRRGLHAHRLDRFQLCGCAALRLHQFRHLPAGPAREPSRFRGSGRRETPRAGSSGR